MTLTSKYDCESVFNVNTDVCFTLADPGGLFVSL